MSGLKGESGEAGPQVRPSTITHDPHIPCKQNQQDLFLVTFIYDAQVIRLEQGVDDKLLNYQTDKMHACLHFFQGPRGPLGSAGPPGKPGRRVSLFSE